MKKKNEIKCTNFQVHKAKKLMNKQSKPVMAI